MQNHQFDLQPNESICFGEYKVTLLGVEDDAAVLEFEGPDGTVQLEPVSFCSADTEQELAVLV